MIVTESLEATSAKLAWKILGFSVSIKNVFDGLYRAFKLFPAISWAVISNTTSPENVVYSSFNIILF